MSNPPDSHPAEHESNGDVSIARRPNEINETSSCHSQGSSSSQATSGPSLQQLAANSDVAISGPDDDDSFRPLMTPAEVTRLIMFLFDASENDELNSSHLDEPTSAIITEDYSADHDNSLTSSFRNRNPLFGTSRESSSSSDTLKGLKTSTNQTNHTLSVSASVERECRKTGLSLAELQKAVETGKKNGEWSCLISLLNSVFSSYDALSSSFLDESCVNIPTKQYTNDRKSTEIPNLSLCSTSDNALKGQNEISLTLNNPDDSVGNIIRTSWDESMTHVSQRGLPIYQDDIEMDDQQSEALNYIGITEKQSNVYWPPVNLNDLRKAWSMIVSIPERQSIIDTLMRAVRRLVVLSLHQLLVIQPPDGLDDSQPTAEIAIIQQKLVNLFLILYECPFATDPLHFELLLLNINRAVTWLPYIIQIMLCRAWASSVHVPLADCTESPNPEQTNLWCLQKILLHHITLRCLTTDHGLPNEDKQICEAALVLRIVYYASLLAGQLDSSELLEMEAEENRIFEQQMRAHIGPIYERRSRTTLPEDPFAKALNISPNDCRKPFIPVKDFVNETLNDGLQPKKDYIYYRSKGISNELSFMKLPFLLQTSSKSVLLYYDNRMRMLDERRGVLMHTFFMDTPEMPFFKVRVHRDRIVEDALLILEIACLENPGDFKKQLLIEFEGEQGIDEGGLSKEFFQLIIERIFNPDYGMFILDEETQNYWFNPVPIDDMEREYCLIGTLLGLAIYNDVILDINFPSVLYRKLVGKLGTFEDLFDAKPTLAQGLKSLLEYEYDNIEEAFGCSFVINYLDPFGSVITHELKPNGATIPVTKENRKVYDFNELERVTTYEEYTSDSPVIKNFWSVVHSMTKEQQKQLLQFSTGSDRVPVGGMSKMKFTIARQGADTNRFLNDADVDYIMAFKSPNDIPDSTYAQYACFDVLRLATVRGAELAAFESSVNVLTSSALTGLQRLPVRLRRRAASHRVNRLPHRFHRHHHLSNLNENGSKFEGVKLKKKLKSRRYRRRKLRLMAFHERFTTNNDSIGQSHAQKPLWLPTHIWHAKRFHMITKWGWRLPYAPTSKLFKACHRASHNGCLVFDFSYLNCFQIYGPENLLVECLNGIFRLDYQVDSCLPELSKLKTPLWSCEQTGILYATNKRVHDISRPVLGPIRVLWGSLNSVKENFRHVWLWLHPSMSSSAWDLLQTHINEINSLNVTQSCSLQLNDITGYFCRLRLIGRQSHGLISDIIQMKNGDTIDENWTYWNNLSTSIREAACVPPGLVIPLSDCKDFRSNRPRLKIRNRNWSILPIKLNENNPLYRQQQPHRIESSENENGFVLPSGKQLSWLDIQKFCPSRCNSLDQLLSTQINQFHFIVAQSAIRPLLRS
ncbi:Ubiquitin-protein ligase E3A [Schistosoma japonicum]|nr:Ubiquitin-protein ligase E3A [Schistosoma japonicum]